jgi:hypothetical protein
MNCEWCQEGMNAEAVVCPSCKRERKDFHNLKMMMYTFSSISILAIVYGFISGDWTSMILEQFEVGRAFKTASGWLAIITLLISIYTYIKASKIIKTWCWY